MGWSHMVASRPRQPSPALPHPTERDHSQERRRRRAARARTAASRQPRGNLDSLAIGAPLTAALVGVLLTEGDAALGVPGTGVDSATGGGVAARGHDSAIGATAPGGALARVDVAGEGGTESIPSSNGEIIDPVAAAAAAAGEVPPGDASGGLGVPPGSLIAAGDQAALGGPINIALGAGAPPDELALQASAGAEGTTGSDGRIGVTIAGTDGDDVIHGTPYDDRLFGGGGNDTIFGYEGDDLLDGGSGNDRLFGGPGNDRLLGASGNDQLFGGTGDDSLSGGLGNDRLFGEEGRDSLDGGPGDDLLDGGPGADRMFGGTGNDRLIVDNLHDVALENGRGPDGGGDDVLEIGAGFADDLPDGVDDVTFVLSENLGRSLPSGSAAYTQQVGLGIEHVILEGTADFDVFGDSVGNRLTGNAGDNLLSGGGGDDILAGGAGSDRLLGGSGRDHLEGGSDGDVLLGGSGQDELYGGDGDDLLDGGRDGDLLYGGGGNDTFVIGLNDSAVDTLFDHDGRNLLTIEDGAGHRTQTAVVGDELYVVVDNNPVAIIGGYLGSEQAFEGIDSGHGVESIADLMAPGAGAGPALATATKAAGPTFVADDDLLGAYLSRPSLTGTTGADQLFGTSSADWLNGDAGNDHLFGGGGRDVLQGRDGSDIMEGGAGDDRYLFTSGETGFDTIRDSEGANIVELDGFAGARLTGRVVGNDLYVVAEGAPVFAYENFVNNEQAFAGVRIGDELISADDLLG
jgi:Ca2+-binding RTX toxin-like protein